MPRRYIYVAIIAMAAVVAVGVSAYHWRTVAAQQEELRAVEDRVRGRLKDPESAQFRGVRIEPRTRIACGQLNAKNSYGGYVGFVTFIARPTGEVVLQPTADTNAWDPKERMQAIDEHLEFQLLVEEICPPPLGASSPTK